jgi:hypothetical protein
MRGNSGLIGPLSSRVFVGFVISVFFFLSLFRLLLDLVVRGRRCGEYQKGAGRPRERESSLGVLHGMVRSYTTCHDYK